MKFSFKDELGETVQLETQNPFLTYKPMDFLTLKIAANNQDIEFLKNLVFDTLRKSGYDESYVSLLEISEAEVLVNIIEEFYTSAIDDYYMEKIRMEDEKYSPARKELRIKRRPSLSSIYGAQIFSIALSITILLTLIWR